MKKIHFEDKYKKKKKILNLTFAQNSITFHIINYNDKCNRYYWNNVLFFH